MMVVFQSVFSQFSRLHPVAEGGGSSHWCSIMFRVAWNIGTWTRVYPTVKAVWQWTCDPPTSSNPQLMPWSILIWGMVYCPSNLKTGGDLTLYILVFIGVSCLFGSLLCQILQVLDQNLFPAQRICRWNCWCKSCRSRLVQHAEARTDGQHGLDEFRGVKRGQSQISHIVLTALTLKCPKHLTLW